MQQNGVYVTECGCGRLLPRWRPSERPVWDCTSSPVCLSVCCPFVCSVAASRVLPIAYVGNEKTEKIRNWRDGFHEIFFYGHFFEKLASNLLYIIGLAWVWLFLIVMWLAPNGNGQIFNPRWAPKPLNLFRWNLEYITRPISGVWPLMKIHMALRQSGWSRRTRDLTRFGFLVYLFRFFTLSFGSCTARTGAPILTVYTSYDVLPPKEVPFGVALRLLPI